MAIILGDDFNATFRRLAAVQAGQQPADATQEQALRAIQKTLRGDKVHITEQRAGGPLGGDARFVVLPTQTIGDSGIDLFGVYLTDGAGLDALQAQGVMTADMPVYDRLGAARSEAAARNGTDSHDRFAAYMKECAAQGRQPDLTVHDRLTMPQSPAATYKAPDKGAQAGLRVYSALNA